MRHTRESIEVKVDIFWHDDEGEPVVDGVSIDTAGIAGREDVLDILDAELEYERIESEIAHAERRYDDQRDTFDIL